MGLWNWSGEWDCGMGLWTGNGTVEWNCGLRLGNGTNVRENGHVLTRGNLDSI